MFSAQKPAVLIEGCAGCQMLHYNWYFLPKGTLQSPNWLERNGEKSSRRWRKKRNSMRRGSHAPTFFGCLIETKPTARSVPLSDLRDIWMTSFMSFLCPFSTCSTLRHVHQTNLHSKASHAFQRKLNIISLYSILRHCLHSHSASPKTG